MNDQWFPFRVGEFECFAVSDGAFTYAPPLFPSPVRFLFPDAPKALLEQKLRERNIRPDQWGEWISPYTCLLVDTGGHRVLIDTGAGQLGPDTGKLPANLRSIGCAPDTIDLVILTHGHPDHIGGNINQQGRIAFPGARFAMGEDEWNFWTGTEIELHGDEGARRVLREVAHRNLPPVRGQMDLIDREGEIVPGISVLRAPGHTPGHLVISIASGGENLLCLADAMLHPIHIEQPDWYARIDFSPEETVKTRYKLLSIARETNALVMGFHFPFPGLGRVTGTADRWVWEPL